MKTKITIGVVILFVIGIIAIIVSNNGVPKTSAPYESTNPNASTTQTASNTGKTYTLAEVATHTDAKSCWTTISGGVYDVTSWISQHPGGRDAILSLCGKDGSDAFNGQHGGQARPAAELASFKIGTLAK